MCIPHASSLLTLSELLLQFYWSLVQYVREKRWGVPGHSDLNVRLEEFQKAKDGRCGQNAFAEKGEPYHDSLKNLSKTSDNAH